jgi:hypothetical protein
MSDFFQFVCWFACVFVSALCIAGFTGNYSNFQSEAVIILLSLCLSVILGSSVFLGFLGLRDRWNSYERLTQHNTVGRTLS